MVYQMFTLYHKVSRLHDGVFLFRSTEHALYELKQKIKPEQYEVYMLCNVGEIDVETGEVEPITPVFTEFPPLQDAKPAEIATVPMESLPVSSDSPTKQVADFTNETADLHGKRNPRRSIGNYTKPYRRHH